MSQSFWTGFRKKAGAYPAHNVRMYMQNGKYASFVRSSFTKHVSNRTLRKIADQAIKEVGADKTAATLDESDRKFFEAVHRSVDILKGMGFT